MKLNRSILAFGTFLPAMLGFIKTGAAKNLASPGFLMDQYQPYPDRPELATVLNPQQVVFHKYISCELAEYITDTIPVKKPEPEKKETAGTTPPAQTLPGTVIEQKIEVVQPQPAVIIKTVPKARRQVKPVPVPKVIQPKPVKIIKPKIVVKTGLR